MHAVGYTHTVALMGTNISKIQIEKLKQYCCKAVILLDVDTPGEVAAQKINHTLIDEGFLTRILRLPPGEDPDSFLKKDPKEFCRFMARGTTIAHPSEKLLIEACVIYPDVVCREKPFTELLTELLIQQDLPFQIPLHREMLHGLTGGRSRSFEEVAKQWRKKGNKELEALLKSNPQEDEGEIFLRLLILYMEKRVEVLIYQLTCRMRYETEEEKRIRLLDELTIRQQQECFVATYLERIWMDYFPVMGKCRTTYKWSPG